MKAMICFTHPAWVHQFHHIIWRMRERGDEVLCFVAEKDGNSTLLERYGIPYVRCAKSTGKTPWKRRCCFEAVRPVFPGGAQVEAGYHDRPGRAHAGGGCVGKRKAAPYL